MKEKVNKDQSQSKNTELYKTFLLSFLRLGQQVPVW